MPLRRLQDRLPHFRKPMRRISAGAILGGLLFLAGAIYINMQTANRLRSEQGGLTRLATRAVMPGSGVPLAYTTNELVEAMARYGGSSKRVRAIIGLPGTTAGRGAEKIPVAPTIPTGIWPLSLATQTAVHQIAGLKLITLLPFSAKQNERVGLYYLGSWPAEKGIRGPSKAPAAKYGLPEGFIKVEKEDMKLKLTEHFYLGDFLTHNQPNVWPKYLVLQPELLDKLELVLVELEALNIDTEGAKVMSGFRTPSYNSKGGNTQGRSSVSRHIYGDAADLYIDSNKDGQMDDLNKDGRLDMKDAWVIERAASEVEAKYPELIGGVGVYPASSGHGPFAHIDVRGYKARWTGGPGGG